MAFIRTEIESLWVYEPKVIKDDRGYFFESFNKNVFDLEGLILNFVQDNESKSSYGVLRGLHYQIAPYAQAKLVRVLQGEVLDIAVDIRKNSPTYGKSYSLILSQENKKQLFIPRGFAHGFVVLSNTATFFYKCDNYYSKKHERGIIYNDKKLNINWKIPLEDIILSEKDNQLNSFDSAEHDFNF